MAEKFALEAVTAPFMPLSQEPIYTPPPECIHAMEQLVHEFTMRPAGYEWVCRGLLLGILTSLLEHKAPEMQPNLPFIPGGSEL